MEDFVQILGLIMNKTTRNNVTEQQVNYVTSRLSNNPVKANLGTGEGKSSANMLLLAAQYMLHQPINIEEINSQVLMRDLQVFHEFFNVLGINAGSALDAHDTPAPFQPNGPIR